MNKKAEKLITGLGRSAGDFISTMFETSEPVKFNKMENSLSNEREEWLLLSGSCRQIEKAAFHA